MSGENACGNDVLVWGPAAAGERTMGGRILPAGWVWTCGCGAYGCGYETEEEADQAAEHEHQKPASSSSRTNDGHTRQPFKVTRELHVLDPRLACRDCPETAVSPDLPRLVDRALDHIERTGHHVTVTEATQVTYGPPQEMP